MIDYHCKACETTQELLVDRDSKTALHCDKCLGELTRLTGACRQFEFKGNGTYVKGKTSHGKSRK
tara:strand:+ start:1082 stop:1276 length:195 start_codon:yes stop_codon:yes gene_type:complete